MSGVWVFDNKGVFRRENPKKAEACGRKNAVLVYLATGQAVTSYSELSEILIGLGWERYYRGNPELIQFHRHSSIDLISLPRDFSRFTSIHMYDVVIKNPNLFQVRQV